MRAADIPQFSQLSTSEKILLLEDLWEEISSDAGSVVVPASHKDELDARFEEYLAHPGDLLSLSELQDRIEKRK